MTAKKVAATAAKAPAKAVAKKAPAKKAVAAKPAAKKPTAKKPTKKLVSSKGEAAFKQIEQEAYFIAERDGFRQAPLVYWCEAEVKLGMRKA